ncbi:hypothetical protein J3Q64DRAFT_1821888 [Phycomyces blakesleeanus]|uniref:Uncharacterized protein n=1 Tax=Phycomyces blakesleeanus TaxID=4837 RepID=A0ABR3AYW4_PHYBL
MTGNECLNIERGNTHYSTLYGFYVEVEKYIQRKIVGLFIKCSDLLKRRLGKYLAVNLAVIRIFFLLLTVLSRKLVSCHLTRQTLQKRDILSWSQSIADLRNTAKLPRNRAIISQLGWKGVSEVQGSSNISILQTLFKL